MVNTSNTERPPAVSREDLASWIDGVSRAQLLYVAAELSIADRLVDGPKSIDALAASADAHPQNLYRVLRTLASIGIFAEGEEGRFELTEGAEYLRSDHPDSIRPSVRWHGETATWKSWGNLLHSVKTGETAFDSVHGMSVFEYFTENPVVGEMAYKYLSTKIPVQTGMIVDAYDFASARKVVDIGGGGGTLLTSILERFQHLYGVLFELPRVISEAKLHIDEAGISDRCELVSGDFFKEIPKDGDIYILKTVIHDWHDDKAIRILRNCHQVMGKDGKVLVIEGVIPPENEPSQKKLSDIEMMVFPGGIERTEEEYQSLFQESKLKLSRIIPTAGPMKILEAVPA